MLVTGTALAVALVAAGGLGATGCGGEEGTDTLNQAQANQTFSATFEALGSVDAAALEASISGGEISASAQCSGGGTASFSGSFENTETFTFDVEFQNCTESDITIDGSLDYGATLTENGFTMIMDGTLTYSGSVEATCDVDVSMQVNLDGFSIEGAVCGQEVTVSITGRR